MLVQFAEDVENAGLVEGGSQFLRLLLGQSKFWIAKGILSLSEGNEMSGTAAAAERISANLRVLARRLRRWRGAWGLLARGGRASA